MTQNLGKYPNEPIDFDKCVYANPKLYFFDIIPFNFGCGPNAISLITGISPANVSAFNKDKPHFSDKHAVEFLKQYGYEAVPLTIGNMTNSKYVENKLTKNHLLLISQMFAKNVASWSVLLHQKYLIHNYDILPLLSTEFLERPVLSSYIIYDNRFSRYGLDKY